MSWSDALRSSDNSLTHREMLTTTKTPDVPSGDSFEVTTKVRSHLYGAFESDQISRPLATGPVVRKEDVSCWLRLT